MVTTEYSWMSTEELLVLSFMKEDKTPLETELAQRLEAAVTEPADGTDA